MCIRDSYGNVPEDAGALSEFRIIKNTLLLQIFPTVFLSAERIIPDIKVPQIICGHKNHNCYGTQILTGYVAFKACARRCLLYTSHRMQASRGTKMDFLRSNDSK